MTKNWLITGASIWLGRGLSERLLARGDGVVATLRKSDAVDDLKAQHDERLKIVACDVTDSGAIRAAVANAFALRERTVLVSNGGYGLFGAAEELSDAQIERQFATNLNRSIQLIRAAIPRLREQGGGRVVQASSEGGQIAYPGFCAYHATTWGIEGSVEALAQEVAAFWIDFVIVEPGPTRTNFVAGLDRAVPLEVHGSTPVRELRRTIDAGYFELANAGKTVDTLLATIDSPSPPFRVALGRSAYESVRAALAKRLAVLEQQKTVALSVMERA